MLTKINNYKILKKEPGFLLVEGTTTINGEEKKVRLVDGPGISGCVIFLGKPKEKEVQPTPETTE